MAIQTPRSNQFLLILLIVLYLISLGAFTYANWRVEDEHVIWHHAVNAVLLSVPLVLLYGSVFILLSAWHEHRATDICPILRGLALE
jgi:hypothetical protein